MKFLKLFVLALFIASPFVPQAFADAPRTMVVAKTAVDIASLADGAGATTTVTVPGAVLGDACDASFAVDLQGMSVTCYISAANTASVRVQNESGGTIDLASTTLRIFMLPRGTR